MNQQEKILNEYEKKYNDILAPTLKKSEKIEDIKEKKSPEGVLV